MLERRATKVSSIQLYASMLFFQRCQFTADLTISILLRAGSSKSGGKGWSGGFQLQTWISSLIELKSFPRCNVIYRITAPSSSSTNLQCFCLWKVINRLALQMEVSQPVRRSGAVTAQADSTQRVREYEQSRQMVLAAPKQTIFGNWKRHFLFMAFLGTGLFFWRGFSFRQPTIDPTDYKTRTKNLLKTSPLIDGHNDLPFLLRTQLDNKIYGDRLPFRKGELHLEGKPWDRAKAPSSLGLSSHTDLKKMRDGQLGAQFWSVYIEVSS